MAKKSRPAPAASNGSGRFKSSVLLGAMLFAPAAFLVMRGNLSVNEALIRFGCALLFAMVGTAVVIGTMPAAGGPSTGEPVHRSPEEPEVTETTTSIGTPAVQPAG
ncbi:hypothetical protein GCM10009867_18430 [Pedococcus aerophilus]|uniref:Uncharacterized protein n=1 Tax=Pedococcus aerophilus TaxID=436356 RepID=A0ABP6H440_9MICO